MGRSLGQRERQTPRETLRSLKWGFKDTHPRGGGQRLMEKGRELGHGKEQNLAPAGARSPALEVTLGIFIGKVRRQDCSPIL